MLFLQVALIQLPFALIARRSSILLSSQKSLIQEEVFRMTASLLSLQAWLLLMPSNRAVGSCNSVEYREWVTCEAMLKLQYTPLQIAQENGLGGAV
jgi:hypothetical protein